MFFSNTTPTGNLLRGFLPRESFSTSRHPALMTAEGEPRLLVSSDRIGLYLPASPPEWA
jgi:hypothetical protein